MKRNFLLALCALTLTAWQLASAQAPPTGFSSATVSSNWDEAVGLTFNPAGSHLFVWERPGRVWTVENGQKNLLLDLREEVGSWRDFGLLGFALHLQFETNGYLYLLYTVDRHHLLHYGTSSYNPAANEYFNATIGRVTRYTATRAGSGYTVDPASRLVLLGATKKTGIPSLHQSHGVGSLVFGSDNTLLISTGDGASYTSADAGSAPETYYQQALADSIIPAQQNVGAFRAQQVESYDGKILRIDPNTGNGLPSNPFYDAANPGAARSKVWALGLRNPFRVTLKPGSGSTNPAAGQPGALYIGDVGYNTWEEINIATGPGLNFGWPLFEGLTQQNTYWAKTTANPYAPNPAAGEPGCAPPYLNFQNLMQQETAGPPPGLPNPCTGLPLPASTQVFMHRRPAIDWNHNGAGPARTGTFSGQAAAVANIGAAGSPVTGPQFGGSSALGGVFYPHPDFPAPYQNAFFFGDYPNGWIRALRADATHKPVAVHDFIDQGAVVVALATHPTEGGLYYVNFFPCEIRKITYTPPPPVAVAADRQNLRAGSAKRTVHRQQLLYRAGANPELRLGFWGRHHQYFRQPQPHICAGQQRPHYLCCYAHRAQQRG